MPDWVNMVAFFLPPLLRKRDLENESTRKEREAPKNSKLGLKPFQVKMSIICQKHFSIKRNMNL
jgi:hypothetical protein